MCIYIYIYIDVYIYIYIYIYIIIILIIIQLQLLLLLIIISPSKHEAQVPRQTCVWLKGILELTMFSELKSATGRIAVIS